MLRPELVGEADFTTVEQMREAHATAVTTPRTAALVDLGEVTFSGSGGIAVLVGHLGRPPDRWEPFRGGLLQDLV